MMRSPCIGLGTGRRWNKTLFVYVSNVLLKKHEEGMWKRNTLFDEKFHKENLFVSKILFQEVKSAIHLHKTSSGNGNVPRRVRVW